jgi:hypothetical protein
MVINRTNAITAVIILKFLKLMTLLLVCLTVLIIPYGMHEFVMLLKLGGIMRPNISLFYHFIALAIDPTFTNTSPGNMNCLT